MTTTQEQYIIKLKQMVVKQFGRNISSADDCAALAETVEKAVGIRIDMPTLQMLFSRNSRTVTPRHAVLSAIAKYVGYAEGWSEFCFACNPENDGDNKLPVKFRWSIIVGVACLIVAVAIGVMLLVDSGDKQSETTTIKGPTPFELMVEDIKVDWNDIIDEHFMEVRIYQGNEMVYTDKVASLKEEYKSEAMLERIRKDIEENAKQRGIIYTSNQMEASIEALSDHCISIIDILAGE